MPETFIETFSVKRIDILNEKGDVDEALMPSVSGDEIKRMYELLVLSRTFDHRALDLQREGRIGAYAPILGQEAAQVGSAFAIEKSDWIFPSFREMGVYITMGYEMDKLFQYWGGDERGVKSPDDLNIFPVCVPVGTQVPHAVGAAMASKYRKDRKGIVVYFGDGGTSKGDFHEGLNIAGVFKLPVVFICQNNQWAISVPREKQTASKTIAQKAYAYGFEGVQVDGNDIFAVYKASKDAILKSKNNDGPTLIECYTYRMSDHTTADDASRYRSKEEVELWRPKDPVLRMKLFMDKQGLWTEKYQAEVEESARLRVDEAVKKAESVERQRPADMFSFSYERPSPRLVKQMRDI